MQNKAIVKKVNYSLVILIHFLYHVVYYTLPIFIVYLRDDISVSYTQGGILWTISLITTAVFSVAVGYYADKHHNLKYLLIYGSILTLLLSLFIVSLANNFHALVIGFFVSGIGAAGYHPPAMAIITEMFEENKGKALSLNINLGMIGTAIAPLIVSGSIKLTGSWKYSAQSLTEIVLLIVILAIALNYLVGTYHSSINNSVAESSIPLMDEDTITEPIPMSISDFKFVFGLSILVPLIFVSIRGSFFKTASFFTAFLYEDYLNLTKDQASIATSLVIGFGSMFTIIGGTISDKMKPRTPLLLSSIGTLISAAILVYVIHLANLIIFTTFYFILIASYYLASPATSALLADRVPAEKRGKLFGALFSIGQLFSMTTPAIFGYLKDSMGITVAFGFILILAIIVFILAVYIFIDDKLNYHSYLKQNN